MGYCGNCGEKWKKELIFAVNVVRLLRKNNQNMFMML